MKGTFHLFPQKTEGKRTKGARDIFLTGAFSYLPQQKKSSCTELSTDARIAYPILPLARSTVCLSASYCWFFSKPQNGDFSLTERTQIVGCKEPQ